MNSSPWLFTHDTTTSRHSAIDSTKTYAERLAVEQLERAEVRRVALAEQKSEQNSPQDRIRTWEKLHGLRLPADPQHMILSVVASSTGLKLSDVLDEQRARASLAPAKTQEKSL